MQHSNFQSVEESFNQTEFDLVVGWSLGGQIALRLIESGNIITDKLILIATPYQFVSSENFKYGISEFIYNNFKKNLQKDPSKTLDEFYFLNAKGDKCYKSVLKVIKQNRLNNFDNLLYWLKELGSFSCDNINFTKIPRTKLIYTDNDALIDIEQAKILTEKIIHSDIKIIENCGHALHLNSNNLTF